MKSHHETKGRFASMFAWLLALAMRWRWMTIIATVVTFAVSIGGMSLVQQQFFPASDRVELIVDWDLPQNSTIAETNRQISQFEQEKLVGNPDIDHWSTYVGEGAPRFILSYDVSSPAAWMGQVVIVTKDLEARDRMRADLQDYLSKTFPGTDAFVKLLDIGPPVGKPVQYRVAGPDIQKVRDLAREFGAIVNSHSELTNMTFDWNEPSRVVKIDVLQDKARQLGISSRDIANGINGIVEGSSATKVKDDIYLIDVIGRAQDSERGSIETLKNLQLPSSSGNSVPLSAVAKFRYELEQPLIARRDRIPTITVKAAVIGSTQPATIVEELKPQVEAFTKTLPVGYTVEIGGSVESSAESQGPIIAVAPLMLFAMATILMIQLQSFSRLFLVFAVAPLALIGVVAALLLSNAPMGFVAILGILALVGILIRNSVILVVQIEQLRSEGMPPWRAVVEATEHRMRPIMLTAAAATLALIPISREVFWGPMAYAMMGGIVVGTVLTLLFLPALYVAWFRIPAEDAAAQPETPKAEAV
jgi:multidrug efflux pump subunit AcrB